MTTEGTLTTTGPVTTEGTLTTTGAVRTQGTVTTEGKVSITLRLMDASGDNTEEYAEAPASDVIRLDHQLALMMKLTMGRAVTIKSAAYGVYWWCEPDASPPIMPGDKNDGDPHADPYGDNYRTLFRISPTNGGVLIMCHSNYHNYALAATDGLALAATEVSASNTMGPYERWVIFEPEFMDDGTPWKYPGAVAIYHPRLQAHLFMNSDLNTGFHGSSPPNNVDYAFYIDIAYEWDTLGK